MEYKHEVWEFAMWFIPCSSPMNSSLEMKSK